MSKKQDDNTLEVYMSFRNKSFPGLIVVWAVGSNKLELCRIMGPKGNTHLETKHHHTYKTAEGAYAGAERWFGLLASIYNVSSVEAKQQVTAAN